VVPIVDDPPDEVPPVVPAAPEKVVLRFSAKPSTARWIVDGVSCRNPCVVKKPQGARVTAKAVRQGFETKTVRFVANRDTRKSVRLSPSTLRVDPENPFRK